MIKLAVRDVRPAMQWGRVDRPDEIEQAERGATLVLRRSLLLDEPSVLHRSLPISAPMVLGEPWTMP